MIEVMTANYGTEPKPGREIDIFLNQMSREVSGNMSEEMRECEMVDWELLSMAITQQRDYLFQTHWLYILH